MAKDHSVVSWLLFFLLVSTGASNAQSAKGDGNADQLIRQIESRYGRMRGLAAEFEQAYNAPGTYERRERGRLILQRPRLMRWEYDPKPGKLFIVKGREVWF